MKISPPRDTSVKLVPSAGGTQSPVTSTQPPQTMCEELEYPQMQITKALGLVESAGMNSIYRVSPLGHTEKKKGGQQ